MQADGPQRLMGDDPLPPGDGLVVCRKQDLSQQIKADPEDGLGAAFVGLEDDGPVFRLPFTGRMGERKGHGQHGEKLADPVGVDEVSVLEIEAARLGSRKERLDLPPPPIVSQGNLRMAIFGSVLVATTSRSPLANRVAASLSGGPSELSRDPSRQSSRM